MHLKRTCWVNVLQYIHVHVYIIVKMHILPIISEHWYSFTKLFVLSYSNILQLIMSSRCLNSLKNCQETTIIKYSIFFHCFYLIVLIIDIIRYKTKMHSSTSQSAGKTWARFYVHWFHYSYSKLHVRKHYKTQLCRNPT